MSLSICGMDCCASCPLHPATCAGCQETQGHPCGGTCVAATCIQEKGIEGFLALKQQLIQEVNGLGIEGLKLEDLNLLNGAFVNLEYPLPNGKKTTFLVDRDVYFGNQIEQSNQHCLGVLANEQFILVCAYGPEGSNPEFLAFRKRQSK